MSGLAYHLAADNILERGAALVAGTGQVLWGGCKPAAHLECPNASGVPDSRE